MREKRVLGERPSEKRFARVIEQLADLPPVLRIALQVGLQPGEQPRYMIYAPDQAFLKQGGARPRAWRRGSSPLPAAPDWLLALTQERLLLYSIPTDGNEPELIAVDLAAVLYITQGVILLHSWVSVAWAEGGAVRQQTIYHNAVSEPYFSALVDLMRAKMVWNPGHGVENASREALEALPRKFKNLIPLHMLLPGETVRQAIFRPAVWKAVLLFFRQIAAPRLVLALTNDHLLLVEEGVTGSEDEKAGDEGSYGYIVSFLPVMNVRHTAIQPVENGLEWRVTLERQGARQELKVVFPLAAEAALNEMARSLNI